jgi:L-threonylcarbamoyladenylate synthase
VLRGGIVAYPTEAVYGLGCLPTDRRAVARLLRIKQRSWRKGLLLLCGDFAQLESLVHVPEARQDEILSSWPGPVTWVLPATHAVPAWVTGGRATVAVRVTGHPIAAALSRRAGHPLVSTSANLSGRAPYSKALQLRRALGKRLDYVLPGPVGGAVRPTEIRDGVTGRVLRRG